MDKKSPKISPELYKELHLQGGINPITVRQIRRVLLQLTAGGGCANLQDIAHEVGVCSDYIKLCAVQGELKGYHLTVK